MIEAVYKYIKRGLWSPGFQKLKKKRDHCTIVKNKICASIFAKFSGINMKTLMGGERGVAGAHYLFARPNLAHFLVRIFEPGRA